MRLKCIIIILSLALALTATAQDYSSLIRSIVANNPDYISQKASIDSDILSLRSENNLPATDIGFEHQWGRRELGNKWNISVSQGFDWPGVYSVRSKAIKSAAEALEFLDRSNYLDKMLEVKLLLIDIVSTRKNIDVQVQLLKHMSQLKDKYVQAYNMGEVSVLDVKKIKIEHIAISRRCNELNTQLNILENTLRSINGGNDCSSILSLLTEYPNDIIYDEEFYAKQIINSDPLLRHNVMMTESQASTVKAARLGNLPGFSLGYIHVNELGERFNGFKVGLALPLFSNRNKTKAANYRLHSLESRKSDIEVSRLSSMYSDRAKVLSLYNEMSEYKPIFENSDNLTLLKKALDGGEISLLTYLQEVNYFLAAQQQYLDIIYKYHYSLAKLNRYSLLSQ